eukprot:3426492-Amphidinium_carterae.2
MIVSGPIHAPFNDVMCPMPPCAHSHYHLDASHIREAAAQTLAFIKRQEVVLDEWATALSLKDEGKEEYKALQSQIEVLG